MRNKLFVGYTECCTNIWKGFKYRYSVHFIFVLVRLYNTTNEGTFHANFAFTLFGLVSGGKTWYYAYTVYPELSTSEAELAKFLYAKSYEVFKENPFLILLGILKNLESLLKEFLSCFQSRSSTILKLFFPFLSLVILCLGI